MSRELSLVSLSVIGVIVYVSLLFNNQLRIDFERAVMWFFTMLTDVAEIVTSGVYLIFVVFLFSVVAVIFITYRVPVFLFSLIKSKKGDKK